jgi:hypothetical protein
MNTNGIQIEEDKLTNAIFYGVSPDAGGSFDKAQARAAARLMLAAPALFDALEACIAVIGEAVRCYDREDSEENEAYQQAKAAIASAKEVA